MKSIEERQALGKVLAAKRESQNLTQEKLVAIADVPLRTLQRAERGDGVSREHLDSLAAALGTSATSLLKEARATKGGSPDLRLKLDNVTTSAALIALLRRPHGVLHVGPEGEHPFNEHVGMFIIELANSVDEFTGAPPKSTLVEADYILRFCEKMGFGLFACRYKEELEHDGKMIRKPTTLIIAAAWNDQRIRKVPKGVFLDYVMDRRKQLLHRVLKGGLNAYDWMEDQLTSKSSGEERVRAELRRIHQEIRAEQDRYGV